MSKDFFAEMPKVNFFSIKLYENTLELKYLIKIKEVIK